MPLLIHYTQSGPEPMIGSIKLINMHMFRVIGYEARGLDARGYLRWRITLELVQTWRGKNGNRGQTKHR